MKQILTELKGEIETIIVGDFNTHFHHSSFRQKIHKKTLALTNTLDQMIFGIYRTFCQKATEYTFF